MQLDRPVIDVRRSMVSPEPGNRAKYSGTLDENYTAAVPIPITRVDTVYLCF